MNICSDSDKSLEEKMVKSQIIRRLREQLVRERRPVGLINPDAILAAIKIRVAFSRDCQTAVVTPMWGPTAGSPVPVLAVLKLKSFKCEKSRDKWFCY